MVVGGWSHVVRQPAVLGYAPCVREVHKQLTILAIAAAALSCTEPRLPSMGFNRGARACGTMHVSKG